MDLRESSIRRFAPQDDAATVKLCAATIKEAFEDDPFMVHYMKRAHTGDFAQGYFRMVCSALKSKAFLFSAADHQSVCMGYFYPKASMPLWRELRQGTQWVVLRCIKGLCKTLQFLKHVDQMDATKAQVTKEHGQGGKGIMYILYVGTRSSLQGKGIGSQLMRKLEEADQKGLTCYLEASSERNRRFYERLGFHVIRVLQATKKAPPMFAMTRLPQPLVPAPVDAA